MEKGEFKIKMKTGNGGWKMETVNGLVSKYFGIHKVDDSRCLSWVVTHLLTGLRICAWDYLREAKLYVSRLEEINDWPIPWDSSTHAKDYYDNGAIAVRVKRDVERDILYSKITN